MDNGQDAQYFFYDSQLNANIFYIFASFYVVVVHLGMSDTPFPFAYFIRNFAPESLCHFPQINKRKNMEINCPAVKFIVLTSIRNSKVKCKLEGKWSPVQMAMVHTFICECYTIE